MRTTHSRVLAFACAACAACAAPAGDPCAVHGSCGEGDELTPQPAGAASFVDPSRYDRALAQWRELPQARSTGPLMFAASSLPTRIWKPIGPSPIIEDNCCLTPKPTFAANGRVNSIAVDPTDHDVLYLGSAGGGVWKSVDRGAHWSALNDQEASLGVGSPHAIVVDPNDPHTIYVGTSSFALLAQSQPRPLEGSQARGILKSTDGGASWIRLGTDIPTGNSGNAASLFTGININTIIVDPADSNVLYLAAGRGGDPSTATGGVFWSTDGGMHWTQGTGTLGLMVESLVIDLTSPASARVLYAGAWEHGVLKSVDGGQSWTTVLSASSTALAPFAGFHKVMVGIAPAAVAPLTAPPVYASVMKSDFREAVLFANTNGGAEADWVQRAATVVSYSTLDLSKLYGGPFSDMEVDPDSPGDGQNDIIYWGGFSQYISKDAGTTFDEIGQIHGIHGDHQAWLVVPAIGTNPVYVGDDGGIWRSEDQGASWTGTSLSSLASTINGGGLQIATFYQLTVQEDATAAVTIGGGQDSGVMRTTGGMTWSGTSNDGIDVAFDKVTTNVAYGIQNTWFGKSEDAGATWTISFGGNLPASQIGIFRNRFGIDPNNAGYLYVGGSAGEVLQSMDAAAAGGTPTFRSFGVVAPGKYVASIDVAPSNSNHVVIAANNFVGDRRVLVWKDALDAVVDSPLDITKDLPARFVTRVAFEPGDENVVYATLGGFGGGHVFRKTLAAATWTDISPAVDIPVNAIAFDDTTTPATLYIGTDLGVLRRSTAEGATWEVVDDLHLPNAAVADLAINSQAGVIRAATWGRGVYELAAPTGPAIFVDPPTLSFGQTCATGGELALDVGNAGSQNLTISSVQRRAGSTGFSVLATPTTPLSIIPGSSAAFAVRFVPTGSVAESAIIQVRSNDPQVPAVDIPALGRLESQAPVIASVTPSRTSLTPPNHKMVPISLAVAVSDNCDAAVLQSCQIISVGSNEPISGTGDGDTAPDWRITGKLTLELRSERAGSGTGRAYTITVRCTDNASNSSTATTTVTVPHL